MRTLILLCCAFVMSISMMNAQGLTYGHKSFVQSAGVDFEESLDATVLNDLHAGFLLAKDSDKCKKYTKMKNAGLVMTIGGYAVMAGGITMMIIGVADSDLDNDDISGLFVGGAIATITGGIVGTAGIPLTIVGGINKRKYCSGRSSQLNLKQTKNGVGLALTF